MQISPNPESAAADGVLRVTGFTPPFQGSSDKNLLDPGLRPPRRTPSWAANTPPLRG
ncbi:MAG: hypothetical protein ABI444_01080 [Candidatus Kapaibacterium sp.]